MTLDPSRLRGLLKGATARPWDVLNGRLVQTQHITRDVWEIPRVEADLDLIAAAVNALEPLLETAEKAEFMYGAALKAMVGIEAQRDASRAEVERLKESWRGAMQQVDSVKERALERKAHAAAGDALLREAAKELRHFTHEGTLLEEIGAHLAAGGETTSSGGLAERLKASVPKTEGEKSSVGSNPTPSSISEEWPSGSRHLGANQEPGNGSGVRIPPLPPVAAAPASTGGGTKAGERDEHGILWVQCACKQRSVSTIEPTAPEADGSLHTPAGCIPPAPAAPAGNDSRWSPFALHDELVKTQAALAQARGDNQKLREEIGRLRGE